MTNHDPQTSAMAATAERRHFKTLLLDGGILLAGFDYCGKSVNVLDPESIAGWQEVVRQVRDTDAIKAVVLVSV